MGINLDAESVRNELVEAGVEHHDLTPEQVEAICALPDDDLDTALDGAADEGFWAAYDSTRRDAIAVLARLVKERKGTYTYTVHVEAGSRDQAEQVMAERLAGDGDYGFPYAIGYDFETDEEE